MVGKPMFGKINTFVYLYVCGQHKHTHYTKRKYENLSVYVLDSKRVQKSSIRQS